MRNHCKLALGTAAVLALAIGAGCTHEDERSGASSPSSSSTPAYSTTNTGSSSYGNPGTGYGSNGAYGGGPSSTGAATGTAGTMDHQGSTSSTQSKGADDSGFDHGNVPGTGSMDNTPSGIGGGPLDKGTVNPDDGVNNDNNGDTKLNPDGSDYSKGKSDVAKPMKGKKGTTDKKIDKKIDKSKTKSGSTGSGFDDTPSSGDTKDGGK